MDPAGTIHQDVDPRVSVEQPHDGVAVENVKAVGVDLRVIGGEALDRPRIDIRFQNDRRNLRLCFEDNGIGIGKGESRKIFRRFYQAGRPGRTLAKGSGLGLNLVQNIARLHKGRVEAESREGAAGSVFTLILPKRKREFQTGEKYPDTGAGCRCCAAGHRRAHRTPRHRVR